jgi:hypothetical protein
MARKTNNTKGGKTVETLKHDEAKRKNIPTAEYQAVVEKEQETSGAARTSRTGQTSSSTPRRSTSRKKSTPRR